MSADAAPSGRALPRADELVLTAVALPSRVPAGDGAPGLPWPEDARYAYGRAYRLADDARLYLFHFGALVCCGPATRGDDALREAARALGLEPLWETCDTYRVVAERPPALPAGASAGNRPPEDRRTEPRVGWGALELDDPSPARLATVALLLGQSAALDRHERQADDTLEETVALAEELSRRGHVRRGTSELVRRVGAITARRLELARWFYVRDRPEATWEDEHVAALHDRLIDHLEMRERYASLLAKLSAVESTVQSTVGLWHARWGHRLEWAIVLLFVLDLALMLMLAAH